MEKGAREDADEKKEKKPRHRINEELYCAFKYFDRSGAARLPSTCLFPECLPLMRPGCLELHLSNVLAVLMGAHGSREWLPQGR